MKTEFTLFYILSIFYSEISVYSAYSLIIIYRWYPPGHGDFYQAFSNSGLLDELIEKEGRSVCFMSNIDNMGATVDLSILKEFIENQSEFIMEVT